MMPFRSHREGGQMVVELCVVMPVIVMVAVALIDGLVFTGASSRFDHLAAQAAIAVSSPEGTEFSSADAAAAVCQQLTEEIDSEQVQIEVSASEEGTICRFDCQLNMVPWPLSAGGAWVLGMRVPATLKHDYSFCIRPYVIGEL